MQEIQKNKMSANIVFLPQLSENVITSFYGTLTN